MTWAYGMVPSMPLPRVSDVIDHRAASIAPVEVSLLRSRRLAVEAVHHPLNLRVDLLS